MTPASSRVADNRDGPGSPQQRLHRDLADSVASIDRLRRLGAANWDEDRLLAVVTAAPSSELYLPYTIPLLLRQAEACGLGVDLVLGLNNGYECPEVISGFAEPGAVAITHLETTEKRSLHSPGLVVKRGGTEPHLLGRPDAPHRIVVVHQRPGPWSAGKDVMLLDLINGLIVPNLERGWRAPRVSLVFDAEAVFTEHEPDPALPDTLARARLVLQQYDGNPVAAGLAMCPAVGHAPAPPRYDVASPGFSRLIAEWRSEPLDVLGPATRFCTFSASKVFRGVPVLLPTPSEPISALHLVYNETCGLLPGCGCLSGAATLASTDVLAGILSVVLVRYPDVYAEDALFTVLAERAGLRLRLTRRVQFSNRCAGLDEWAGTPPREAWKTQFAKWYRGFDQVERLYGAEACASVLGPGRADFLAAGMAIAARRFAVDGDAGAATTLLRRVAESGRAFADIRRMIDSREPA